jgi:hypothetical protein
VSPALFVTGFSLRSAQIQRVFALVELLRGVAAFLVAPILLYLATAIGTSPAAGTRTAIWICLAITIGGVVSATALFVLSGGRLQKPDLERWTEGEPAWNSPPLLSGLNRHPPAGAENTESARGWASPPDREPAPISGNHGHVGERGR